ncbi:MAG: bifunctional UDP-N-acetylglucosamine diphosphorylase/glucosamine-1-phosphate N-acetyltransferase GlmU [Rhodospirillaceae bacterium]|jgi:bifunctional UDP-N-acetylglucosamine pyrophosphorylase / glucosamine-1-phosphate N-acetyltransferase|nr:bifunctional UDP-N-acetylglucosamine diphosphorylase/glucosamine-1-phosphate N-acetyltransferase GlmU [Rhodospirillaceae bacterium]
MTETETAAVILAAGKGTRMKSDLPKVLHPLAGRPMVRHLIATLDAVRASRAVVVVGPEMEVVTEAVAPLPTALQMDQKGTGDAVKAARRALAGFAGDVLVLYGDTPLLTVETLERMLAARRTAPHPAVVVLGFEPEDPAEYGRLIAGPDGALDAIVEFREADEAQRAIGLCNSGVMAIDGAVLFDLLDAVTDDNAKGEYYLTDIVAIARARGLPCAYVMAPVEELVGVNSRADLAVAERILQGRLRAAAMAGGVTMLDPETVWLSHDTKFGRDVVIQPNVFFGPGVAIGDGVTIKAFSHIEGATVAEAAIIGPFARLRPGAEIGRAAHIGNFVEVKAAVVEAGAKANHLSYIGDARIGAGANIGAGTITCNYDGFTKSLTEIGAGAFIGSNSALVAPVKIGDGAIVGAGSTITRDVPADALSVARGDQKDIEGWASKFRARKAKEKEARKKASS